MANTTGTGGSGAPVRLHKCVPCGRHEKGRWRAWTRLAGIAAVLIVVLAACRPSPLSNTFKEAAPVPREEAAPVPREEAAPVPGGVVEAGEPDENPKSLNRTHSAATACFEAEAKGYPTVALTNTIPRSDKPLADDVVAADANGSGSTEIVLMNRDGSGVCELTMDPQSESFSPRISPDRRSIVFTRSPEGINDSDYTEAEIWMMAADGSSQMRIRPSGMDNWYLQGHPEWHPSGDRLVIVGGPIPWSPQIYTIDPLGNVLDQLTYRPGTNTDPSYSADGSKVLFIGCPDANCPHKSFEVYEMSETGTDIRRVTFDNLRDHDPYYSPDGQTVAWLTQMSLTGELSGFGEWDIRLANADGSEVRQLINDGKVSSKPEWTKDGSEIWFHKFEGVFGWSIFKVNPDGTGLEQVSKNYVGAIRYPSH